MNKVNLNIERIIFNDMGVSLYQAERTREMIEIKLKHLLERDGLLDNLTSSDISILSASVMNQTSSQSDLCMANKLAQSIGQALRGLDKF